MEPRSYPLKGKPNTQPTGTYDGIKLSAGEIARQAYKQLLGGGETAWGARGAFQLYFLRRMGLRATHSFLDVGCGPIRGGEHIIPFLDKERYCGIDYTRDFIRAALEIVAHNPALAEKRPLILQVEDFDFSRLSRSFDYVLLFSVLNHCGAQRRHLFFTRVPQVATPETKIFVTHGAWFQPSMLDGTRLALATRINRAEDIAEDLHMEQWGWPVKETIFPILELRLAEA